MGQHLALPDASAEFRPRSGPKCGPLAACERTLLDRAAYDSSRLCAIEERLSTHRVSPTCVFLDPFSSRFSLKSRLASMRSLCRTFVARPFATAINGSMSAPQTTTRAHRDFEPIVGPIVTAAMGVVIFVTWRSVAWITTPPPPWTIGIALACIAVRGGSISRFGWLWWGWGLLTLAWSLTPGTTYEWAVWGALYLAALSAGSVPIAFSVVVVLLLDGGFSVLSLQLAGLHQFFSGSINYLTGAISLAVLPMAFVESIRSSRAAYRVAFLSLAAVSALLALASGARAVYVPMLAAVFVTTVRTIRGGAKTRDLLIAVVAIVGAVYLADAVIPGRPAQVAMRSKSPVAGLPANPLASTSSPSDVQGSIETRFKMIRQAVAIGFRHPFGTGLGSFKESIQYFQQFPTVNFSSAHNFLVEVFATTGWPGLLLLGGLFWSVLSRGWKSPTLWPYAVGTGAMASTMLFDVTWSMPAIPLTVFLLVGTIHAKTRINTSDARAALWRRAILMGKLAVVMVSISWYAPCSSSTCGVSHHLGFQPDAIRVVQDQPPPLQAASLAWLRSHYPRSLWVWALEHSIATTDTDRLRIDREMVRLFPYASTDLYLEWARLAMQEGRTEEARNAIQTGLIYFPAFVSPAGVPLPARTHAYASWLSQAAALLEQLQ